MQFEIVSHACLSIRAGQKRLVTDPWLIGPVYWGAWWHCPEPVYDEGIFQADYVYITHWHFDKSCHFLLPRFPVSSLPQQLRELGFTNITELRHGKPFELGPDFRITSYQIAYQDDSLCFVEAEGKVLANINDSKPLPRTWKRLCRTYPKVDFMLRSHSPAWSYPSAYTFDDPDEAIPVTRESYMEAFRSAASLLKPTYAIPFASSVCHPHRDIVEENSEMVSAFELEAYLKKNPLPETELVLMPPGSRWDAQHGFDTSEAVFVRNPGAFVEQQREATRGWLEELYEKESRAEVRFESFEGFFRGFLRGILPLRLFLKIRLVFVVEEDDGPRYWWVDFRSGKIERSTEEPEGATSIMRVPPAVLDDALRTFVFTNIDISKRWRVHVRRGGVVKHLIAWVLISVYEAGYFKLGSLLRWRFLSGVLARRSEVLDYLALCTTILRKDTKAAAEAVTDPA
jgi:hypothetical protein